mgnify:CR=1 FL=1
MEAYVIGEFGMECCPNELVVGDRNGTPIVRREHVDTVADIRAGRCCDHGTHVEREGRDDGQLYAGSWSDWCARGLAT